MILLGHVSAKDQAAAPYSALAGGHATPQNPNYTDVVDVLSPSGPKHLRIVFPWPHFQSGYANTEAEARVVLMRVFEGIYAETSIEVKFARPAF